MVAHISHNNYNNVSSSDINKNNSWALCGMLLHIFRRKKFLKAKFFKPIFKKMSVCCIHLLRFNYSIINRHDSQLISLLFFLIIFKPLKEPIMCIDI